MNNRETLAQRTFVAGQRRYRRRIAAGRILLFFAFLAVWELSAETGLLDDFIFSSPSRALRCFFWSWPVTAVCSRIWVRRF